MCVGDEDGDQTIINNRPTISISYPLVFCVDRTVSGSDPRITNEHQIEPSRSKVEVNKKKKKEYWRPDPVH